MKNRITALFLITAFITGLFSFYSLTADADQAVYERKCSTCHSLRNPDSYTKKQWDRHVRRMAQRAGLTEKEIISIIDLNTR